MRRSAHDAASHLQDFALDVPGNDELPDKRPVGKYFLTVAKEANYGVTTGRSYVGSVVYHKVKNPPPLKQLYIKLFGSDFSNLKKEKCLKT